MEEVQSDTVMPAVATPSEYSGSAMSLVMDNEAMDRMMAAAELMASAKVTIPKHLQNSVGDCMAVIMQSAQWKMNPFAVAQKTHLSQSGQLGYESQLINAVIVSCGAIKGQPTFEFFGDWKKILGKVVEKTGQSGGKYYVRGWTDADEDGLGVTVRATLRGESSPREVEVLLAQCWPRFSTQWATDPQQQITYAGVRKFSRRNTPGAILGVYTPEELDEGLGSPSEREINPRRPASGTESAAAAKASQQQRNADQADERAKLIKKMESIASEYGIDAYAEEWSKLTKAQRTLIGTDEHERLKKVASSIPGSSTAATGDGSDQAEPGANG